MFGDSAITVEDYQLKYDKIMNEETLNIEYKVFFNQTDILAIIKRNLNLNHSRK